MVKASVKDLMFKSAMYYREKLEFSVIPVGKDKKPLISWQQFQTRKPTRAEVMDWWLIKFPEANIGIITGKISDLVVIDIDDPKIKHKLIESIDEMASPPACSTPRGGRHLYFKYPINADIRNTVSILEKVDIRGEGGYVLAPPSQNGTGTNYSWIKGRKITDVTTTDLPVSVISLYNSISLTAYKETPPVSPPPILQGASGKQHETTDTTNRGGLTTNTTNYYTEGRRDEDLFHIANCLVKGGAEPHFIRKTIETLAMSCQPPFSLKEADEKLHSALNRQTRKDRSLASDVEEYVKNQEGYFDAASIVKDLQLATKEEKKHLTVIIHRLKERNIIKPYGGKAGRYAVVTSDIEVMDFMNAKTEEFPIELPLNLSSLCKIYPGNVVIIAGTKSSGKTAFNLNLVKDNMAKFPIVYMNSEMGETELRIRLEMFEDLQLKDWKFTPIARSSNWEDLITHERKIFVIDYLDITDDLWKVGSIIKNIHEKLRDGIAIISIQRNYGASLGRGGSFSMEKARLYINLDYDVEEKVNKARIQDCKAWREKSPRGMEMRYILHRGSNYTPVGGWHD